MSVVIYGKNNCVYCHMAKTLAESLEISMEYKNLNDERYGDLYSEELSTFKANANVESKTVPQIWWNGRYIGGYHEFNQEVENTRNFGQEKI